MLFLFGLMRPDALTPALSHTQREQTQKTATEVAVLLLPCLEVCIHTHIPGTARFIIRVRTRTVHIGTRRGVTRGLGITRTPLTFVKDVIHAAGQADVFGHVPGRTQANNAVRADFIFLRAGNRLTFVVVFLRLLLAVPGEGRLQRHILLYLPAQG